MPAKDDCDHAGAHELEPQKVSTLDVPLSSPVIRRLIEEVRANDLDIPRSYNRTYNRHNR